MRCAGGTSGALTAPLEIAGPVDVRPTVSSYCPATDVTAKLIDVHPEGTAFNVLDGIAEVRLAGSGTASTVTVTLGSTAIRFGEGHRIRLHVSSSNFHAFPVNPNSRESRIAEY